VFLTEGHFSLVSRPEGKRPCGRLRRRREDNINIKLQEEGRGGMDWNDLAQDRESWQALVNFGNELWGFINCGKILDWHRTCQLLEKDSVPWS
jgi:hypothetical protein